MASVKSFKRKYLKLRKSFDVVLQETDEIEQKIADISQVYRRILMENTHLVDLFLDMNETTLPTPPASPPGSPYRQATTVPHVDYLEDTSVAYSLEKPIASTHKWLSGLTAHSKSNNPLLSAGSSNSFSKPSLNLPNQSSPASTSSPINPSSLWKQKRKRATDSPSERRSRKRSSYEA
ncbi:Ino80 complex subunit Iec3 [Schizosaccharomyces cryophilus OY26]|uniref:Ino80 complex subunit Iec3 n=1 Tax=Schizosaccharomyces cryophilus (strain OY26 / ATCC MYA-4695 / CBS 11777 / NBRC 106824 / NRRL Y48691) TaxID=653667 RepID=S9VP12_SCHCR|nr:Ino80 complex subunit Iec3 [Schizosaccharomyces cryophilus OY26]EPY49728.1 Ino80 complex subunit Iec3 [Schizosaccharomyces cryophilus OY26]